MIILLLMKIMKLIIIISCMTIQLCVCNKVFISQMFLSWNYFVFDLSLIIFLQIYLNDINIFNIISCFLYLVVMHAYGWLSKILSCIFSWIDIRKYKCEWIWYDRKKAQVVFWKHSKWATVQNRNANIVLDKQSFCHWCSQSGTGKGKEGGWQSKHLISLFNPMFANINKNQSWKLLYIIQLMLPISLFKDWNNELLSNFKWHSWFFFKQLFVFFYEIKNNKHVC